MRGSFTNHVTQLVSGIIILFFVSGVWWFVVAGNTPAKTEMKEDTLEFAFNRKCASYLDCEDNVYGSRCTNVVDPNQDRPLTGFCGCQKNDDCFSTEDLERGETCGQNNRCE